MTVPKDSRQLAYVGAQPTTVDRNSWYTPARYVEAARTVLDSIDFDPYSDAVANVTVGARLWRSPTKQLLHLVPPHALWPNVTTVFMNPPYGRGVLQQAVNEFVAELDRQNFAAVVLTNNATETKWFEQLASVCDSLCFTNHRIAFTSVDNKQVSGNTRGQTFLYYGTKPRRFARVFGQFGNCWRPQL